MRRMIVGLVAVLALLGIGQARAAVEMRDWHSAGDGLLTFDTDTGLEWLDLTESLGRSFIDISSNLGSGDEYDGWRYATGAEILDLWANVGIPDIDTAYSEANYFPVLELIELMGCTGACETEVDFSFAMSADIASPTEVFSYWVQVNEGAFEAPRARARTGAVTLMNDPKGDIASWLVRESITAAVPEPASVAVWSALCIAGFVIVRRRRRHA